MHCRTGSLEITEVRERLTAAVHCRTGSLEIVESAGQAPYLVHCRTGSLENLSVFAVRVDIVHCRTGSLETTVNLRAAGFHVHCRTGSLEIYQRDDIGRVGVHCRTGSLGRINSLIIRINCAIHFWTTNWKISMAENSDSRGPTAGRSAIFALSARHSAFTAATPQQISSAIADARATQER